MFYSSCLHSISNMATESLPLTKQRVTVPVLEAYDLWAKTYDSDGNVLQLLDNELIDEVLPALLFQPLETIVDFGCGTGRNTEKLLRYPNIQQIFGLDGTPAMLAQAKSRMEDPPIASTGIQHHHRLPRLSRRSCHLQ
ncbi:Methyltransferase small domain-containing protein [Mycena venus]|uniref:Methyltransferase small domain-containing protein n=1 Tax=Mycena venus TaxID=2733690 RepID=A0A8H6Y4B6_9AGAR|nr:Methyltransferase small domain-containing protein [Mycena venus]